MNTFTLLNLVLHPEKATDHDLDALKELVQEYPYFQAGHLLIAKITSDSEHIKRAAAYTSERSILMKVINSDFNPDVNLPDIDNLEIGNDDLSIFDKLEKEDSQEEEIVKLESDSDFNETFGDLDIEFPDFSDDVEAIDIEEEKLEKEVIEEGAPEIALDLEVKEELIEETSPTVAVDLELDHEEFENTEELSIEETVIEEDLPELTLMEDDLGDSEEDEEEDDLMDELAELKRLQAEMQQNRKEAEEAMQAEEDREEEEVVEESTTEESEGEETTTEAPFADAIFDYPAYDFDTSEEEKTEAEFEEGSSTTMLEDTLVEEKEEKLEVGKNADDLSFFENENLVVEKVVEEETAIEVEEVKEEMEVEEVPRLLFNFDDDDILFDLDALLEEESQRIDPIKELEKKPIAELELSDVSPNVLAKQNTLISEFIEKSPSIKIPKDSFDQTLKEENDLAEESFYVDPNLVSENLATIYVKQGKFRKAADIYRQLILKYPEKKAYFADLIENLEK